MKEEGRINKWPFVWGFLLYTVGNIDYFIIPFILKPLSLSFWTMFVIATPLANLEIIGGYYFWKWFIWRWLPTTEPIKETVEFTKSITTLLREYGLLGMIVYRTREQFKWAINNRFSKAIGAWGHAGMFILGAESFISGGRLIGTILCASAKKKNGLYSLMVGNTIHVAVSIWTWNLFFYLWDAYRIPLIIGTIVATLFLSRRFIWRKFGGGQDSPKSP